LGSVVRHKGVHMIIEALRLADVRRVELRVLGQVAEVDYAEELRERAAAVPSLTLRLHGAYAPDELPKLLEGVHCVVAPSQVRESFSITTREAYACGLPVVAARLGALEEAVTDGVNGFTFTHDRIDELAGILATLAGDRGALAELNRGVRGTSVMSIEDHAREMRALYTEATTNELVVDASSSGDSDELRMLDGLLG
jgi:glycosyltransferase involved in cell wall biosynthesis